jgi:hypothetical protein
MEKAKAVDIASRIKNKDRQGRATVVNVNETPAVAQKFWEILTAGEGVPANNPAARALDQIMSRPRSPDVSNGNPRKSPQHPQHHLIATSADGGDDEEEDLKPVAYAFIRVYHKEGNEVHVEHLPTDKPLDKNSLTSQECCITITYH